LDARSTAGRELIWLDVSRRGAQPWVQLSVMQNDGPASSGWLAWPQDAAAMAVRVDDGRTELLVGDSTLWTAPDRLREAPSLVRRASIGGAGMPVLQATGCGGQTISDREVQ